MEYTQDQIDAAAAAGMTVEAYVAHQTSATTEAEAPVVEEAAPETTEEVASEEAAA